MSSEHPFVQESKQRLPVENIQIILLDDMLRAQHELIKMEKEKKPVGKMVPMTLNLTANAAVTKIDYLDSKHFNLPANTAIVKMPKALLHSLVIRNDGSGDIVFDINVDNADFNAPIQIKSRESYEITPGYPLIASLNIQAVGANATVRLIGFL